MITKADYWAWLDRNAIKPRKGRLKDIQDAFVADALAGTRDAMILEMGGGIRPWVLSRLARHNRCWNLDRSTTLGRQLRHGGWNPRIRTVRAYMGDFSPLLAEGSFDIIFSVSVVEHIPNTDFAEMIRDCHRLLKPGGRMYHAIDLYLGDQDFDHPALEAVRTRVALYHTIPQIAGFAWLTPPAMPARLQASPAYADNSCDDLYVWNRLVPALKDVRARAQSCSLRLGLKKL